MPPSNHLNNIPLALHTRWFAHDEPQFPYPALRAHSPITTSNYTWEYLESAKLDHTRDHTFIGAVLWEVDGSITKIRIRWNSGDIDGTVKGEVKSIVNHGRASSRSGELNANELRLAARWYGSHIVQWCQSRLGRRVGDGECWSLAYHALEAAGKAVVKEGYEPPMLSTGRVHGQCIFDCSKSKDSRISPETIQKLSGVHPGDILELADAHFHKSRMVLDMMRQEENVRLHAHTAVIVAIRGEKLSVVEQNARVKHRVIEGEYDLAHMVEGRVKIYRPVGRSVCPFPTLQGICDGW